MRFGFPWQLRQPVTYKFEKLVPKLKYQIRDKPIKLSTPEGPFGRLRKLRNTVTALVKYERIELNYWRGTEARDYAERLISEAMRYGDRHRPTMEMADFWLAEKQLVHKLFKVLVPRYRGLESAVTKIHVAPHIRPNEGYSSMEDAGGRSVAPRDVGLRRCILELKGNPLPPVVPLETPSIFHIHNILLQNAKEEYHYEKHRSHPQSSDLHTGVFEAKDASEADKVALEDSFSKLNVSETDSSKAEK